MGPRARIACIDVRPADRNSLRSRLEDLYKRHRQGIRFGMSLEFFPSSREELFVSPAPNAFVVGSGLSTEAAYALCVELKNSYPQIPVLLFLSEDAYSLRILRRFESVCDDVFCEDESQLRVVHSILRFCSNSRIPQLGRIYNFIGSKGGVGTTSAALSFADALSLKGSRVAVVDLSKSGVVPFYLGCERWESRLFSGMLSSGEYTEELYRECVVKSPTGLSVVLPPSGGNEVRDTWLHDTSCLEVSVSLLTHIAEEFDYIVVDSAHAEGLLPFAIACRAECNVLVTSNEAAAVHLAGQMLSDIMAIPGEGSCSILTNSSLKDGLSQVDAIEFLERYAGFAEIDTAPLSIPYDSHGRYWIGTGQTFYGCAGSKSRIQIDEMTQSLLGKKSLPNRGGILKRLLRPTRKVRKAQTLYLPAPDSRTVDTLEQQNLYTPPQRVNEDKSETLRCGVWKQQ